MMTRYAVFETRLVHFGAIWNFTKMFLLTLKRAHASISNWECETAVCIILLFTRNMTQNVWSTSLTSLVSKTAYRVIIMLSIFIWIVFKWSRPQLYFFSHVIFFKAHQTFLSVNFSFMIWSPGSAVAEPVVVFARNFVFLFKKNILISSSFKKQSNIYVNRLTVNQGGLLW